MEVGGQHGAIVGRQIRLAEFDVQGQFPICGRVSSSACCIEIEGMPANRLGLLIKPVDDFEVLQKLVGPQGSLDRENATIFVTNRHVGDNVFDTRGYPIWVNSGLVSKTLDQQGLSNVTISPLFPMSRISLE
ncbi:MAG: hypothetical protein ACE363_11650 [Alphaproteobacteria bacterium]